MSHKIKSEIKSLKIEDAEIHVECLKEAYPNATIKENVRHQGEMCRIVVDNGYSGNSFGLQVVEGKTTYNYVGYEGRYRRAGEEKEHLDRVTKTIHQKGNFGAKKLVSEAQKSGFIKGKENIKSQTKAKRITHTKENGETVGAYECEVIMTPEGLIKKLKGGSTLGRKRLGRRLKGGL